MTNREWLESLSDKELASVIAHIGNYVWLYSGIYRSSESTIEIWLSKDREKEIKAEELV